MANGVNGLGGNWGPSSVPNEFPETKPVWEKLSLNVTEASSISPGVNTLNGTVNKTEGGGALSGGILGTVASVASFFARIFGGVVPTSIASLLEKLNPGTKKEEEKDKTQKPGGTGEA